jgi:hypothetical protein
MLSVSVACIGVDVQAAKRSLAPTRANAAQRRSLEAAALNTAVQSPSAATSLATAEVHAQASPLAPHEQAQRASWLARALQVRESPARKCATLKAAHYSLTPANSSREAKQAMR